MPVTALDTKAMLQVPSEDGFDKYTASIELSNACRQFYKSRVETAEAMKEKWDKTPSTTTDANGNGRQKNSIDKAMETLRAEMASLMDQDLSLMKQLLTLNETIEDLKWQRKYYYSKSDLQTSSCDMEGSDWSVSETEMYESDSDVPTKYPSPSNLSLEGNSNTDNDYPPRCTSSRQQINLNNVCNNSNLFEKSKKLDSQCLMNGSSFICHSEQNSFDSGIHEPSCDVEIRV
ncbi:leucine rich adaptor protein 1-like [Haliotis rubra]|uniref:leucine rich adaptor protein 1-like n=1 Tax=Haliotis rubra TaxID=36100 RepID=UPI001EE5B1F2|nr:leucine rich adaptor protein 1-like [Haliotis rubra]